MLLWIEAEVLPMTGSSYFAHYKGTDLHPRSPSLSLISPCSLPTPRHLYHCAICDIALVLEDRNRRTRALLLCSRQPDAHFVPDRRFYRVMLDDALPDGVLAEHAYAVVHCAAKIIVPKSVEHSSSTTADNMGKIADNVRRHERAPTPSA